MQSPSLLRDLHFYYRHVEWERERGESHTVPSPYTSDRPWQDASDGYFQGFISGINYPLVIRHQHEPHSQ